MAVELRRANPSDADFLVELNSDDDVRPFLGPRTAADRGTILEEIERSRAEPEVFGRFLIEVDGEPAGALGFHVASERSRIARVERLAVHPRFRGRRVADEAARQFHRFLFEELGFHRLELEVYAFNERACAHTERVGFVREGRKRRAYLKDGEWVDSILYALLAEDLAVDDDPFRVFAAWWEEENVPMVLATAGPSARAVVLEEFDERGFVFWTSSDSPTGRALAADPRVALVWLWDGRQARVEGRVEPVSEEENERHWAQRDGRRQLAAFRQSEPVESREALLAKLDGVPEEPERPSFWRGYRVLPERFDFWLADPDFVHDRFEYVRDGDGWRRQRLQP